MGKNKSRRSLKKKPSKALKKKAGARRLAGSGEHLLSFHSTAEALKKQVLEAAENLKKSDERIQDIEIHLNLLTRLITTLCIEKFGMRVGVLKRLIKRIEKEAIRDSQIMHLENLYQMSPSPEKPGESKKQDSPPKSDPWEEIS